MSRTSPSGTAARIGRPAARYSKVLYGISPARARPADRAWEEEQVGRAHQRDRLAVRRVARAPHERVRRATRGRRGQHAGQVQLDPPARAGSASMRARSPRRGRRASAAAVEPGYAAEQRGGAGVARRCRPNSVCIEPVCTMRNAPSAPRRRAPRSRRARSRSGCRDDTRAASSGIAAARARRPPARHDDRGRGRSARAASAAAPAAGARRRVEAISSSAHGSSRSATHGTPARARPAPRRRPSRREGRTRSTVGAAPASRPRRAALLHPPAHQRSRGCRAARSR